jgi:DNA-binding response OmpR family regulator
MVMPETLHKRILVVDDDPWLIKSLCNILQTEGYHVTASDGGQAGIDAFQSALAGGEPFDVVITDFGMRVVDGRGVAIAVKNASPSTPVILLTGWGQWFEKQGGTPLPVDGILYKPPKLRELREVLARCLNDPKN